MAMPRKPAPTRKLVMEIVDDFNAHTGWFNISGRVDLAEKLRDKAAKWPYFLVLYRFLESNGFLNAAMIEAAERPLPGGGRPPVPRTFSVSKGTNPKGNSTPTPAEPEPEPIKEEKEMPTPKVEVTATAGGTATVSVSPAPAKAAIPSLEEIRAKLAAIKAGMVPAPTAPSSENLRATVEGAPKPFVPPVVFTPPPPPPKPVDPLALLRASILSERYGVSLNA